MAIRPPSDLILDVAAAADPSKLQAATERLDTTGGEEAGAAFEAALVTASQAATAAASAPATSAAAAAVTGANAPVRGTTATITDARNAPMLRDDTSPAKAMRKLEAFFLQSALQEMLPKDAEALYGAGLAGDIWKSMLAEQLAAELAKSAKFGIAERLAGHHFDRKLGRDIAGLGAAFSGEVNGGDRNLPFLKSRRPLDTPALDLPTFGQARTRRS